jgi:hypothetical protein
MAMAKTLFQLLWQRCRLVRASRADFEMLEIGSIRPLHRNGTHEKLVMRHAVF